MNNRTINLLLIDDDAGFASLAKHFLKPVEKYDFKLIWENNFESALTTLKNNSSIDLILMDYHFPSKNGLEFSKQLFEINLKIPIVFLTTNKDIRVAIEAMKYGISDYILKADINERIFSKTIVSIFERLEVKKQIENAEKEKLFSQKRAEAIKELIVTLCHEINNPLAAIKISASILSRQNLEPSEKQLFDQLNEQITRLDKQVQKIHELNLERPP